MEYKIYCVVVNYNDSNTCMDFINNCMDYKIIEKIVVVDNCSTDNSYEILKVKYGNNEKIDVIKSEKNGGYGYGNNVGIRHCFEKYNPTHIIVSNPDVKFTENVVQELYLALNCKSQHLVAAPKMIQKNGSVGNLPWKIPSKRQYIFLSSLFFCNNDFRHSLSDFRNKYEYVDCVSGAFLMFKAVDDIKNGVYDENVFLFCEETLIGMKYKKMGLKTIFLPNMEFIHLGSESINKSYASEIKKLKITLRSRYYVLCQYYKVKKIETPFIRFVFLLQILELSMYLKIRKFLPWKRKK